MCHSRLHGLVDPNPGVVVAIDVEVDASYARNEKGEPERRL